MNTKVIIVLAVFVASAIAILNFPKGLIAVAVGGLISFIVIVLIRKSENLDSEEKVLLSNVFLLAMIARAILASVIYSLELQKMFGPDAVSYDEAAFVLVSKWAGLATSGPDSPLLYVPMTQFVAGIYYLIGRNPLTIQMMSASLGAASCVVAYLCALSIFRNARVARYVLYFSAFLPAMVIWSSQMLKDGFIVFLLILSMLMILRLEKKLNYAYVAILLLSMLGIYALRFYIFPMLIMAVSGAFLVGYKNNIRSLAGRLVIVVVLGLALSFSGIFKSSQADLEKFANFQFIDSAREYASDTKISGSSIEDDTDVSSLGGAIAYLPFGILNLLLAPFPWQVSKGSQALVAIEMFFWWVSLPFLFIGFFYILKNRLRECVPVLVFTLLLSLSYAIYQGNIGTMYRQRTQVQIFFFLFTSVGIVVMREKKENSMLMKELRLRKFRSSIRHS